MTLYLLASSNLKLRPALQKQLRPGARIVSHNFSMGDWEPSKVETFRDAGGQHAERCIFGASAAESSRH